MGDERSAPPTGLATTLARWMTLRLRPVVRALATSALFLAAWGVLHVGFWHRDYAQEVGEDVVLYESYGDAVKDGQVPYRDFAVVYPPAALPAFLVPAPAGDYARAFEITMLACGLAMAFLVGLATPSLPGLLLVGLSPPLVGSLAQTRYDLWPALLTTGAMVALLRDRHRLGWAVLAAAVVAKGYTICLVPLAALWTARRAGRVELGRAAAWGAGVAAVLVLPFLALSPGGLWRSVHDQLVRPLQIESLGGAILMQMHRATIEFTYGSHNVAGHPASLLATGSTLLVLAALLWVWWRFGRDRADAARFCAAAAAAVCAYVAFGKVLSPQYLIWLVPLVALVPGRRGLAAAVLLAIACAMTLWWTPTRYGDYKNEFRWAWVVLGRDLVLVALFTTLAWPAARLRDRGAAALDAGAVSRP
jgi:hypothetical protein